MSLTLIEKKLSQLRGHIRLMFFAWGLAKLTMWAAGLTLWLFYSDMLLKLPGGFRLFFLLIALVILGVVAVRSLIYPLSRTLSDEDLALLVEREYPLLNDRLISSLQMLKNQERYKDAGSEEMIRAVVGESFDIAGRLQFNEAVRSRRLLYMVMGSLLAMVLLFGHAWFARDPMSIWVKRALGQGPDWPTDTQLDVLILSKDQLGQYPTSEELVVNFTFDPEEQLPELGVTGVYQVASNSDLRFIARPSGEVPDSAEIIITTWQKDPETGRYTRVGKEISRPMERSTIAGADDTEVVYFSYNKMSIISPLEQITIKAGDATAGPYTLRVIPAPELDSALELTFQYPEYLVLEPRSTQELAIDAVAGTQVEYRFSTTKPLMLEGPEASALLVDFNVGSSQRFPIDTDAAAGENHYKARIPALQLGMSRYRLKLVDRQGIENAKNIGDLMQVKEDVAPTVRILFSGDPLVSNQLVYITRDAVLPIELEMIDDYGIGSAKLFWRFQVETEYREFAPFAARFKELETSPRDSVKTTFTLDFSALIDKERIPTGTRPAIELYVQAFDLNQVKSDDDSPPQFQGSKHHTVLTYELYEIDELRAKVSSQIRQIRTTISSMATLQDELLATTKDALARANLLDFRDEEGQRLRNDLDEAYKRQNQMLRDAEVVLNRFGVFAQVYRYNRLERKAEDLNKPQEARIQAVRLLLAIAAAERDLQQRVNSPLVRLEAAEDADIARHASELVANLSAELLRAQPDAAFSADSFGKLIQETGLFTPGSMERARGLYESLLEVGIKPNERRELLVELQKQQQLSIDIIAAVQEQVKKWEGYDSILHDFRNLLDIQKETNTEVKKEVTGD
ncbi:MAG: hypothetical protein H6841_00920 [Planctomycetes bacterium]|nr:hypothetical protein [Planctomycetota bacterium]MCB9935935.1 hypothetical protein [Planctomycetota bacterium]